MTFPRQSSCPGKRHNELSGFFADSPAVWSGRTAVNAMKISRARRHAYSILLRIERDRAYSSEVLAANSDGLAKKDRALSHKLSLGVLRKQMLLDHVVSLYSRKPANKIDIEILIVLRIALYQIHFLDRIPDFSAINEAVEMTRHIRKKSAAGFVNAVLRKASKWNGDIEAASDVERISLESSHPLWLVKRWCSQFGIDRAASICRSNNKEPNSAFRLTSAFDALNETAKNVIKKRIEGDPRIEKSKTVDGAFVAARIEDWLRDLSEKGLVYFQDEASQEVAGIVAKTSKGSVLDLCAAPGSKATLIARGFADAGFVVAGEYHLHRAKALKQNALVQQARVFPVCLDGTRPLPFNVGTFDTILVDAPCSGTGTIRRNPEIRYRVSEAVLNELHTKQLRLLFNASKLLNDRGVLIYSTCSLESIENEDVIEEFLQMQASFEVFDPGFGRSAGTELGTLRTFPDLNDTDGFFVSSLRLRG